MNFNEYKEFFNKNGYVHFKSAINDETLNKMNVQLKIGLMNLRSIRKIMDIQLMVDIVLTWKSKRIVNKTLL